jgi:hypothetical protein
MLWVEPLFRRREMVDRAGLGEAFKHSVLIWMFNFCSPRISAALHVIWRTLARRHHSKLR